MAKTGLVVKLRIEGARETLRAFRGLPKDATQELRVRSKIIADIVAFRVRGAALADGSQSALLAPTVRSVRDRLPAVQVGGPRKVGRNRKPAYKVLFGSEFGANHLKQFRPHRGTNGYWFFPAVEASQAMIGREWNEAADRIIAKFSRGAA